MLLVLASQALTVRRKQSFNTQNIPILGAGAADAAGAAGAVFRDTAYTSMLCNGHPTKK